MVMRPQRQPPRDGPAPPQRQSPRDVPAPPQRQPSRDASAPAPDFVVADRIVKHFPVRMGAWRRGSVRSVDGVSFRIRRGEVMGLVGESGCGKSTLARVLLRLLPPDSGTVTVAGRDLSSLHGEDLRRFRTTMQLVFQDPRAALDPRMRIGTSLEAPLAQHGIGTRRERSRRAADMLREVGLDESFVERLPRQCSGGELQRIAIARALLLKPRFLVCDEPTSALDASLRARIVNLLVDLKSRFDLTLLLISHDLRVVRHASDRVAVMYLGRIVEIGTRDAVFDAPLHPYTRALIAASLLEENGLAAGDDIRGEPPSPLHPPRGCHYHSRCAIARPRCANGEPELAGGPGRHHAFDGARTPSGVAMPERAGRPHDHRAACFFPGTQAPGWGNTAA